MLRYNVRIPPTSATPNGRCWSQQTIGIRPNLSRSSGLHNRLRADFMPHDIDLRRACRLEGKGSSFGYGHRYSEG